MTDAREALADIFGVSKIKAGEAMDTLAEAGLAIVPVEPTEAMILSGQEVQFSFQDYTIATIWQAMLRESGETEEQDSE